MSPVAKAAALIAGPILFAALVFQLTAPGRGPGVYVEVERRGATGIYPLTEVASDASELTSSVANALAWPEGAVVSFFVVDAAKLGLTMTPASTQVRLLMGGGRDPRSPAEPLRLTPKIVEVSPDIYRVSSDQLGRSALDMRYFRQALTHSTGSRAAISLLVGLVLNDVHGKLHTYAVRIEPHL